jgi:NAD(P)H-nitrite reductase large subunit
MYKQREKIIVCRCMEVSEDEIRTAVRKGATTVDAVKRVTMAGMGLCQSKTCYTIIARIINEETGIDLSKLEPIRIRIPVRPIKVESLYIDLKRKD